MIDTLRNSFEPLYTPESRIKSIKIGVLPKSFVYADESTLVFDEGIFKREIINCFVRESGVDAWGYRIDLSPNMLFRWISGSDNAEDCPWYVSTDEQTIWVETAGKAIETMKFINDVNLEWKIYQFREW